LGDGPAGHGGAAVGVDGQLVAADVLGFGAGVEQVAGQRG
jgi:hypothetical protein